MWQHASKTMTRFVWVLAAVACATGAVRAADISNISPASNSTVQKVVMGDPGIWVQAKFTDCMVGSAKLYAADGMGGFTFIASNSTGWQAVQGSPGTYKIFVRFPGTYTGVKVEVSGTYQEGMPPMWKIIERSTTNVTITD
jgi:hypothetical protein